MLRQMLADWNTAIQSRKVINGTTSPKGVVLTQNTKFKFRDTEFEMFTKLMHGDDKLPENKRRYVNEIFVPKTNKFVPTTSFKSYAAMMAAILCALKEGNDHEDRVAKRNQKKKEAFFAELRKDRKVRLSGCGYSTDEVDLILNWIDAHVYDEHMAWCETAIDIMCKYYSYITGRGLIELGVDLKDEARRHIDRMYTTIVNLMRDDVRDRYGYPAYTKRTLSKQFLFPKENISYGVYTVRSAYAKIFNDCDFSAKFRYVTELIAALYEHMTGTSLQDKSAEVKIRQERMYEKHAQQAAGTAKPRNKEKVVSAAAAMPLVGSSIGDLFGDVLDVVKTEEPQKKATPKKKKNKAELVTDKQVTSLQHNLKQGKAEAPAELEEDHAVEPEQEVKEPVAEEPVATTEETDKVVASTSASTDGFNNAFAAALDAAGVDEIIAKETPKKRTRKKKTETEE